MHACEECTFSKRCFAAQIAVSLQWEQGYKGKKVVSIQQYGRIIIIFISLTMYVYVVEE